MNSAYITDKKEPTKEQTLGRLNQKYQLDLTYDTYLLVNKTQLDSRYKFLH